SLSEVYEGEGNYNMAATYAMKCKEIMEHTGDASIYHPLQELGTIYGLQGNQQLALEYFQRAISSIQSEKADGELPAALMLRGDAYFRAGQLDAARSDCNTALSKA